jgi:hypothetical protein
MVQISKDAKSRLGLPGIQSLAAENNIKPEAQKTRKVESQSAQHIKKTRTPDNQKARKPEKYKSRSKDKNSRKVENQTTRITEHTRITPESQKGRKPDLKDWKKGKTQLSLWLPDNLVIDLKMQAAKEMRKLSDVAIERLSKE